MKHLITKLDIIAVLIILALILGILSSYFHIGILSLFLSVFLPILFIANVILGIYGILKKKYFYLTGVILFFLFFKFLIQFSIKTPSEKSSAISILSYNVRGFKTKPDSKKNMAVPSIVKFIDSLNSDIVLLQEPEYEECSKIKGYKYHFMGYREDVKKTLLVIYSKYPIIKKGYLEFVNTTNNAFYVDLKIEQDTVRLYNIHLQSFKLASHLLNRNGGMNTGFLEITNDAINKQIEQARIIKTHAKESTEKVIFCGDFNVTPYSLPYRILKKGLNDSFFSKGNGLGTTYSLLNYPLRLDYFLSNKQIEIMSHKNFNLNLSDHEPIYINFKII